MTDDIDSPGLSIDDVESEVDPVELSQLELDKKLKKCARAIDSESLCEELDNMTVEDLKRRIVRSQVHIADVEASMERDEALQNAKDTLADLKAPYRDAIKHQKAVAQYATLRLKERS